MKVFVIDVAKCKGCYCCQVACKDEHVANDWAPYAKPQPDTGQFWVGISEFIRGTVPKVMMTYIPNMCLHCDDAPCINACKSDAIYKREDGLVIIDPEKCKGDQVCINACPYDAIFYNKDLNIAQKCSGCAHLLDNDDDFAVPRCVEVCPSGALNFGDETDFEKEILLSEPLKPNLKVKTRVHYLNLPKKWISGTLYDPTEEEVIIGAVCTLKNTDNGDTVVVQTDNFGDFWFKNLVDNTTYSLTIEHGKNKKIIPAIKTDKDMNLGDIAFV